MSERSQCERFLELKKEVPSEKEMETSSNRPPKSTSQRNVDTLKCESRGKSLLKISPTELPDRTVESLDLTTRSCLAFSRINTMLEMAYWLRTCSFESWKDSESFRVYAVILIRDPSSKRLHCLPELTKTESKKSRWGAHLWELHRAFLLEKYATLILDASKYERDHGQKEMPRWDGTHMFALSKPSQPFRQRSVEFVNDLLLRSSCQLLIRIRRRSVADTVWCFNLMDSHAS